MNTIEEATRELLAAKQTYEEKLAAVADARMKYAAQDPSITLEAVRDAEITWLISWMRMITHSSVVQFLTTNARFTAIAALLDKYDNRLSQLEGLVNVKGMKN